MIRLIQNILRKIWNLWAVVVASLVTLILAIPLFISVSTPRFYGFFSVLARIWSVLILFCSGFLFRVKGRSKIDRKRQYVVVANHSSILDIMLSYVAVPLPMMFIGKESLARIPVFGMIYRASNILVDRTSLESRRSVLPKAKAEIARGRSICIYPEGTSKHITKRLVPFKDGAFVIAIDCGIPILPVTFLDNCRLFPSEKPDGHPGVIRAVIDDPIETAGMTIEDKEALKQRVFDLIDSRLEQAGR